MATKTTGAELKAFYDDKDFWPESIPNVSIWFEEVTLKVNGLERDQAFSIADDLQVGDEVTILTGCVLSEGERHVDISFEAYFKKWRKLQNNVHLSVSVPKDKLDAVKAAIKAAGGSVQ